MNLAELLAVPIPEKRTNLYHLALRKGQQAGIECFYDRLKQPGAVEWVKKHLDPQLQDSDFSDELRWFPVRTGLWHALVLIPMSSQLCS